MSDFPNGTIRICILSTPAHLPVVRAALERLCELIGFEEDMRGEVVLAVDEALTNIIRHAYHDAADQRIEIALSRVGEPRGEGGLHIELRNWGQRVDPSRIKSRELDDVRPGGLGVHLMNTCMDEVEYHPAPEGGTRLSMTKMLRKEYRMSPGADPIQNVRWVGANKRTVVLEAVGDIDLHRSTNFQQALLDVASQRPECIVLDLSGVGYMDSSGVASLVKLLARVRRDKVALKLSGLTARVRSVFEITRLDTVFDIYADAQEALQS